MISQSKQKGFTIVELLIVIVVIGILAAISIVAYNNVTQKARDDQRLAGARDITNALAAYNSEHSRWISDASGATFASTLTGFDTVKVSADTISKIGTTVPSSTSKDVYTVTGCGTSPFTGVTIQYYKEAGTDSGLKTMTSGTGC